MYGTCACVYIYVYVCVVWRVMMQSVWYSIQNASFIAFTLLKSLPFFGVQSLCYFITFMFMDKRDEFQV